MQNKFKLIILACSLSISAFAQESDSTTQQLDESKKPVRDPWTSSFIIDQQTTLNPYKGNWDFIIHHRFSSVSNGISDLYGFYGSSNLRLGVNYAVCDKLMLGFGTEKDRKYQEFLFKYSVLQQNRGGSIPVSVSLFGNTAINTRDKEYFGNNYEFSDRLSYYGQIIVARKFTDNISFQCAASYSHVNKVESRKVVVEDSTTITTLYKSLYQNDAVGLSALGSIHLYRSLSLLAAYDQGFYINPLESTQLKPRPNVALGLDINTPSHAFQVFVSSYRGITPQQNFIMNQADFKQLSQLMLGFNICVRF